MIGSIRGADLGRSEDMAGLRRKDKRRIGQERGKTVAYTCESSECTETPRFAPMGRLKPNKAAAWLEAGTRCLLAVPSLI